MTHHDPEFPAFPMLRGSCPFSPPDDYREMREHNPVAEVRLRWSGKKVWVLTKHEHVKRVLGDATMSSSWKKPNYPMQVPVPDEVIQTMDLPIGALDAPEHGLRRRLLVPELTAKQVEALCPRIQRIVDRRLDAMLDAGGPVDLMGSLARTVPALVFCELTGVPMADSEFLRDFAELNVKTDADPNRIMAATAEMDRYLDELITAKEADPRDDMLSRIIARNNADGRLDRAEIISLAKFLLFGGFDTTSNMIALGVLLLLEHPAQLAELRADPALLPGAIEEMIRYLAIADSNPARVVPADLDLGGVRIPRGDGVIALTAAACRDPEAFEHPDVFDIHRDARGHTAFGHGPHLCPGANLARAELEIVFDTLFRRIPDLRLAVPRSAIEFKSGTLVHGVAGDLPVTW
ncbi:cytochrome P450 [Nocardia sp. NPDC051030]|uniref:cytochrome P450 n=1 Tax=Nocardia sp. NPDC051030 TaxID=3155162 RepID=UPI003431B13B